MVHHPFLFKEKTNACSRGSKKNFWRCCQGVFPKVNIPSPHHNPYLTHYIICHLPLVFLSPTSPLSFYSPSLLFASFSLLASCLLVCWIACLTRWLKIILLCGFTNTNNNDFIITPIAPLTDVESCEINTAFVSASSATPSWFWSIDDKPS